MRKAVADDVGRMHHLVGHTITDMVAAVVTPLVALGCLFRVDWRLALLTLVPVVAGFALYGRMMSGAKTQRQYAEYDAAVERVQAGAVEFVQGIAVVKTFGQARRAHHRFTTATDDFSDVFLRWVSSSFRTSAVMELLLSPVFPLL